MDSSNSTRLKRVAVAMIASLILAAGWMLAPAAAQGGTGGIPGDGTIRAERTNLFINGKALGVQP